MKDERRKTRRDGLHAFYSRKLDIATNEEFEDARRDLATIEVFLLEGANAVDVRKLGELIERFEKATTILDFEPPY